MTDAPKPVLVGRQRALTNVLVGGVICPGCGMVNPVFWVHFELGRRCFGSINPAGCGRVLWDRDSEVARAARSLAAVAEVDRADLRDLLGQLGFDLVEVPKWGPPGAF